MTEAAVRETHCATVFFTGDHAYKVKKAVHLGFLDFTTRRARRAACHREVRLNRRLAPDVYLGVAEVRDPAGEPCDWIVVMRRMPAERSLARLLADGVPVRDELRQVARLIATFHATADRSPEIDRVALLDGLRERWTANLTELVPFRGDPLDAGVLAEITDLVNRYLAGRQPLLAARARAGVACDGHGDLIADDIFCLPDGPRVLDCLEFDDHLRWVDALDDAAFLAMDLERLGRPDLGAWFLDRYAEFAGTERNVSLEHHYIAYRAVVRSKVACLRHAQGVAGQDGQARQLAESALRHLRLAEPRLVLVGGRPGTGKSTVAGRLADELGGVLVQSDRVRKEMAGISPATSAAAGWQEGIYSAASTVHTYREMLRRAELLLGRGETVVLDASWRVAAHRQLARAVAAGTSSRMVELVCRASDEVADARIRTRAVGPHLSDATPEIAATMAREFDPWPEADIVKTDSPAR
ncbi:bifunctional aminoglycoside phosphotransferase/ATP-binding protein [Kutzneria sp. CA-103260]|uniref:bifunctional aminoglycoside phosphotransferase/ATP-binding protein n=1 Tax=Kutzneria sp. CA-103260 TaxID=2802641 RepID=UPI001BACD950|nr:bifunctional aminoglycoside phosphotransferase/ATP-binding protein [Kutzneria sp. CA-103260]QUQ64077.1 hypothetical protein JJ691_17970 [Kutzneria sp. CA-103260]